MALMVPVMSSAVKAVDPTVPNPDVVRAMVPYVLTIVPKAIVEFVPAVPVTVIARSAAVEDAVVPSVESSA
jgi:hypothetical protein